MILIVGGSGHLGRVAARRLLTQGQKVRVMTRNPPALSDLAQQGAEVVGGDLRDPDQIRNACQGVEKVLAAAHALNGKGTNNPANVDDQGNRRLIETAKIYGVKHFIFISILGASQEHPLEFFRIKHRIEEHLRTSGLPYTILRPSAYMDLWAELIGEPILRQGKVTIFGRGENPINFISVDDVTAMIGLALEDPHALNRSIDLGGPQNLTLNQVVKIFEDIRGQPAQKRYVPLAAMRAMSVLMRPINPGLARLVQNGIFMDRGDLSFNANGTQLEFKLPLTSFQDWAHARFGQTLV